MTQPTSTSAERPRRLLALAITGWKLDPTIRRRLWQLVGGTGLGQLVLIASTPLVTRLYTPAQFGVLGLFASIVGVLAVVATLKFDFAIVSARTRSEAQHLVLASLGIALQFSVMVFGVLGLLILCDVPRASALPWPALLLAPLAVFLTASLLTLRQWAVRETQFADISRALIGQSVGKASAQIGWGLLGLGWLGLLLAELIGRGSGCVLMLRRSWSETWGQRRPCTWSRMRCTWRRNRRFPLYCLPSTLVDTLALSVPGPLIIYYLWHRNRWRLHADLASAYHADRSGGSQYLGRVSSTNGGTGDAPAAANAAAAQLDAGSVC